jgi:hypothetical protein
LILFLTYSEGDAKELNMEFVFTAPHSAKNILKYNGTLSLTLAQFDTPIRYLCVTLFVPKEYRFSEFYGDDRLKEVSYFSAVPRSSHSKIANIQNQLDDVRNVMMQNIDKVLERGESLDMLQEQSMVFANRSLSVQKKRFGLGKLAEVVGKVATMGVKPVTLDNIGGVGQQFLFERYLILENESTPMQLQVDYKEQTKGFLQKRSLNRIGLRHYLMLAAVLLSLFMLYLRK